MSDCYSILTVPSASPHGFGTYECSECGDLSNDPNIAESCCEGVV